MNKKGQFIVVEGIEGAGKTTAVEIIHQYLESQSINSILTREPGGTPIAERLREIIKEGVEGEALQPLSELLLLYTARVQLISAVIEPALARGDWVISDRFELSTYAYQGAGRGISKSFIDSLSRFCVKDCKPDLIFFMNINPELGFSRVKARGKLDRMEQESMDFFMRIYEAYHRLIGDMDNVCIIDASLSRQSVHQAIILQLQAYLANHSYV